MSTSRPSRARAARRSAPRVPARISTLVTLRRAARGALVGLALATAAAAATAVPRAARAQRLQAVRPDQRWERVETPHFTILYARPYAAWALDVARHIESVRTAVDAAVGFSPRRTTILIDDPYNVSNGFALPFVDAPVIVFWPVPPDPRSQIGNSREWGEMLAVHEFAHVAHLSRPSRNPWQRFRNRLLPVRLGPISTEAPRWAMEGYATFIEGRLTGSGRPHGAWRPAILRQWALEGRLPTYGQLSSWEAYEGGAMAYLAGSAYLEWLAARRGDSSLVHVWRRLTARRVRDFDEAFAGVFGDGPAALYGRFTVDVTARALEVQRRLGSDTTLRGALVQRLDWGTGDPALSRDGKHIAIVLHSSDEPARVVVWSTAPQPPDTAAERREREALKRDPQDVSAIHPFPPPRKPLATLLAIDGRAFDEPRWLPGGTRLLVTRATVTPDGALRPDLYLWDVRAKRVRRVTHGAGVRMADPSPDGRYAIGVRCTTGACDLVRVTLATGAVTTVRAGSNTVSYYRPRYSPNGRTIALSVQRGGTWRVALIDASAADPLSWPMRVLADSDRVNRYDATFAPDGEGLVLVSERGGIPNVARLDPATGAETALTRVTGAAVAPEPDSASHAVYFLRLHARGWDLARVADSASAEPVVQLDSLLTPAAPVPARTAADSFPAGAIGAPRAYGVGPRFTRFFPGVATIDAEGEELRLAVANTDPVGRLTIVGQWVGGFSHASWRAGSLAAAWRTPGPIVRAEGFVALHDPASQRQPQRGARALRYDGATLVADLWRFGDLGQRVMRLGGSYGRLRPDSALGVDVPFADWARRTLGFAQLGGALALFRGMDGMLVRVGADGSSGSTAGARWWRTVGSASVGFGRVGGLLRAEGTMGLVRADAPEFERFTVGGSRVPLVEDAVLDQRIAMPALPFGVAGGRRLAIYRAAAELGPGVEAYYWGGAAGETIERWHRVTGIEGTVDTPPLGVAHLPAMSVRAGVGYSLDPPLRKKVRGYLSMSYAP